MAYARRTTLLATAACAAAAVAVLAAYLGGLASAPRAQEVAARSAAAQPAAAGVPPAAQAVVTIPSEELVSTCPEQPLLPARGPADGQFLLPPEAAAENGPSGFVAAAREAAQEGRVRDAEVALLAACRAAEGTAGASSAPVGDAKSQLARHYVAQLARAGEEQREALRGRAAMLWEQSAQAYAASLGRNASKTRMARESLAALQLSVPEPQVATTRMGAARELSVTSERQLQSAPAAPLLVGSDPELAQLDRDLQRLRVQAIRVARDPAGMRRREAQALAQRNARCRDKACLLQWYAQRRRQLLAEF